MFAGILQVQVEVLFHPFFVVFFAGILHVHELSLPPHTGLSLCVFLSMRTLSVRGMGFGFGERERKKEKGGRQRTDRRERKREREMERGDARGN
jgi:hypothetical protein